MKNLIETTALELLKPNNTVTTLEIKTKLRKDHPYNYWTQNNISLEMDRLAQEGKFTYTDNGTFRVYSDPSIISSKSIISPKSSKPVASTYVSSTAKALSRIKALELMQNNKGHFFTVEFVKQDGTLRKLNGQWVKDQKSSPLGYVLVKESGKLKTGENAIRNVNIQTLQTLKIGGEFYKIRK